ncbi:MAG TPA: protein TolR [Xanthomonadaceae bacterium]|nr:protein TolR [Xanthomonadaceae bacterium]
MPVTIKHKKRRPMAEINVVPYIDVMLVLLIIFMVTAPLLTLGVDIQLPQAEAKTLEQEKDPVLVEIDQAGRLYLRLSGELPEEIDAVTLGARIGAFVRNNPNVPVLIGGDERVSYGDIYQIMVVLQQAGVAKVGLMSQPVGDRRGN